MEKAFKILNIVLDYVFIPIMLFLILFSCVFLIQSAQKKVPNIFGNSVVRIMSGSMRASGFKRGDVVIIKKTKIDSITVGDIIAFYYYSDPNNPRVNVGKRIDSKELEAEIRKASLYFHQIVDTQTDDYGFVWFQTQGTSNTTPDHRWIREDYLIGRYYESSKPMISFLSFMSTSKGIVSVVIIPCSILLMIQAIQLIFSVSDYMFEKKLLKGLLEIKDEEIPKIRKIAKQLNYSQKLIAFDAAPKEQKDQYYNILYKKE